MWHDNSLQKANLIDMFTTAGITILASTPAVDAQKYLSLLQMARVNSGLTRGFNLSIMNTSTSCSEAVVHQTQTQVTLKSLEMFMKAQNTTDFCRIWKSFHQDPSPLPKVMCNFASPWAVSQDDSWYEGWSAQSWVDISACEVFMKILGEEVDSLSLEVRHLGLNFRKHKHLVSVKIKSLMSAATTNVAKAAMERIDEYEKGGCGKGGRLKSGNKFCSQIPRIPG